MKQRPAYLKEAGKEKTKKIIEDDIDVDMDKIRRRVAEMEEELGEGAGVREDQPAHPIRDQEEKGSIGGDLDDSRFTITYDDQEDRVEEVGHQITKSGRVVIPPSKFSPDTTTKKPSLSPRERKRRQSLRKKEKKTKNW